MLSLIYISNSITFQRTYFFNSRASKTFSLIMIPLYINTYVYISRHINKFLFSSVFYVFSFILFFFFYIKLPYRYLCNDLPVGLNLTSRAHQKFNRILKIIIIPEYERLLYSFSRREKIYLKHALESSFSPDSDSILLGWQLSNC